jgi:AraC family transcriptional regulator, regulatory protein of adaptative response / DNA-3-methyladenine glycosylase II
MDAMRSPAMNNDAFNKFLKARAELALSPEDCYKAFLERDSAYDGVFFIAVKTTKIYCRTTCKAKKANFENCMFYSNAALAEQKGYRSCLRCHPERAPHESVDPIVRIAAIALKRIYEGALVVGSVGQLAAELNVSTRHLRRALQRVYRRAPAVLANEYRLECAERLLETTQCSVVDVAAQSGFSSIRRFNEAFREKYDTSPSEWRRVRCKRKPGE